MIESEEGISVCRISFHVEGMHCKNREEEVVNDNQGVAGKVNMKQGLDGFLGS